MVRKPDKETMRLIGSHLEDWKRKYQPQKVLLFGSRGRGDHLVGSDIDIIIVSKKFMGIGFRERIIDAYGMWDRQEGLDVLGYTPDEFEEYRTRFGIVKQAAEEGIYLVG